MKRWQVIVGFGLWFLGAGCAHNSPLRTGVEESHAPTTRAEMKAEPPAPVSSDRGLPVVTNIRPQFGSALAIEPENEPKVQAKPYPSPVPGQVRTIAFREQFVPPPPRKVEAAKPITLTLDDVEIRKAFELLAKEGSMNILVSPAVSGKVSISLKAVSMELAFEALLKATGVVAQREKGIIYIYTPEEVARIGDEKMPVRMYRLNYIKSTDLEKMIKPFLSAKGKLTSSPPSSVGIQSTTQGSSGIAPPSGGAIGGGAPGGSASPGAGAGGSATGGDSLASGEVVIIQDREDILKNIEPLIAQLDVQPSQVLIEAMIILVKLDKGKEFGINFAVVNSAGKVLSVVGNGALLNTAVGFTPATLVNAAGLVKGSSGGGFAQDKYAGSFGFTSSNIQGFLRAVETLGKTEILAAPRLLVLNKQLAELQLGDRLGYTTISQSLVSTTQQVQFLNVGTQLRVRPFISSDGMVRMEIHPERSSGSVVNNVPQTNTAELTTNVMVPDGATIVIGGLIENIREKRQNGIPYLSNLPGIGVLFRERTQTDSKTELIVLLTPRILHADQMNAVCPIPGERMLPIPAPTTPTAAPINRAPMK